MKILNNHVREDILSILASNANQYGSRIALQTLDGKAITYKELLEKTTRLAKALYKHPQQRIALVAPNGFDMSMGLLASMCSGVSVPVNPGYTASEYIDYFRIAHVDALLFSGPDEHPAKEAAVASAIPCYELTQLLTLHSEQDNIATLPAIEPSQMALLMLTSGSTGRPKVVPLTHSNIVTSAQDVCRSIRLNENDRCLCMWEQYHIGGVVDLLLAPLLSGGSIILAGSFNAQHFFQLLTQYQPTWFQCVPTTLHEIQMMATRNQYSPVTSLRLLRCVAAGLPHAWLTQAEQTFRIPIIRTFGMTEASPLITSTSLDPSKNPVGSVGISCGPQIKISDPSGTPLAASQVGEVAIRGKNIFTGYENDPELNRQCFREGWFYTGDLGYLDKDGQLFLTGRAKDIINRGGEKISPAEIEDVFLSHPDVNEAAAFACPHRTLGEEVGIALVMNEGIHANREQLTIFASNRLASFKIPKAWLITSHLPRNAVGKILRSELPALYADQNKNKPDDSSIPLSVNEILILDIWRTELDAPKLQFSDDFFDSGGDSLSSLRIAIAIEHALQFSLPEDIIMRCHSPAAMVTELKAIGAFSKFNSQVCVTRQASQTGNAGLIEQEVPAEFSLHSVQTIREFELLRHTLGSLSTPQELLNLLAHRSTLREKLLAVFRTPRVALRLAHEQRRLKRTIISSLENAVNPNTWTREQIGEQAFLFNAVDLKPEKATLIVGFSSRAMRLTAATYHILCALDPSKHALLLLRDPHQNHYEDGIPGAGCSIEEVSDWLKNSALVNSYDRIIALGTSAGGVPAIIAAVRNRWSAVLTCGADTPDNHPRLKSALRAAIEQEQPNLPLVVIAYSGSNQRDQLGARALSQYFPIAKVRPDLRFKNHALLHELQNRGELSHFLKENLLNTA